MNNDYGLRDLIKIYQLTTLCENRPALWNNKFYFDCVTYIINISVKSMWPYSTYNIIVIYECDIFPVCLAMNMTLVIDVRRRDRITGQQSRYNWDFSSWRFSRNSQSAEKDSMSPLAFQPLTCFTLFRMWSSIDRVEYCMASFSARLQALINSTMASGKN